MIYNTTIQRYFEIKRKRPKEGGTQTTMLVGCRFLEQENGEEEVETEALSQGPDGDFSVLK